MIKDYLKIIFRGGDTVLVEESLILRVFTAFVRGEAISSHLHVLLKNGGTMQFDNSLILDRAFVVIEAKP